MINRFGLAILAGGLTGAALGLGSEDTLSKVGISLFTFATPIGGITAFVGKSRAERRHQLSLRHAQEAARTAAKQALAAERNN